jgi:hypothetical protein
LSRYVGRYFFAKIKTPAANASSPIVILMKSKVVRNPTKRLKSAQAKRKSARNMADSGSFITTISYNPAGPIGIKKGGMPRMKKGEAAHISKATWTCDSKREVVTLPDAVNKGPKVRVDHTTNGENVTRIVRVEVWSMDKDGNETRQVYLAP